MTKALAVIVIVFKYLCVLPLFKAVYCYRDVDATGLPRPVVTEEPSQPAFLCCFTH